MIQTFEDLCTYAYVTVDELFQTYVLPHDHRPGPRSTFSDSEVITLTLVAEVVGLDDETVVLSWIEWPDKATRDTAMAKMREDPRMMAEPMPFDGKRMIYGGFVPVVTLGGENGR